MSPAELREWRLARGLTQQQAGELVGFRPGKHGRGAGASWGRLEAGRGKPSETVVRLIRCLGIRTEPSPTPATDLETGEAIP